MIHVLKYFKVNSMNANPKKFQIKILGKSTRQTTILNINKINIKEFQNVELLSLTIDNRLTFKDHINMLYHSTNYKLHALRRVRKYLTLEKIHCKASEMVYKSNKCYEELFIRDNEVSIHKKQLRTLATEIYKSLKDVNAAFIKNYF